MDRIYSKNTTIGYSSNILTIQFYIYRGFMINLYDVLHIQYSKTYRQKSSNQFTYNVYYAYLFFGLHRVTYKEYRRVL